MHPRLAGIVGADVVDGEDRRAPREPRRERSRGRRRARRPGGGCSPPSGACRICLASPNSTILPRAQHHDAVGDLRDDGEVVGDVERRRAVFADELAERGEAFDLRRHVERRGRLVEHQDVGLAPTIAIAAMTRCELAARDLMRIARADRLGVGQIELPEQARPPASRACAGDSTPWRIGASQTCSIRRIAGLNEAAALCAI